MNRVVYMYITVYIPVGDDSGVDKSELSLQLLLLDGHWSNGRSESTAAAGRQNRKKERTGNNGHILDTHTHTHTQSLSCIIIIVQAKV